MDSFSIIPMRTTPNVWKHSAAPTRARGRSSSIFLGSLALLFFSLASCSGGGGGGDAAPPAQGDPALEWGTHNWGEADWA